MVMNNLQMPNDDRTEETVQPQNRGLFTRKPKTNAPKNTMDMEPRERIARYVADIRKARMGLKNGRG